MKKVLNRSVIIAVMLTLEKTPAKIVVLSSWKLYTRNVHSLIKVLFDERTSMETTVKHANRLNGCFFIPQKPAINLTHYLFSFRENSRKMLNTQ